MFDVFALRDSVVGEYRDYFESFVHIDDPQVREFVEGRLEEGEPWPDAVLQLNPAYEPGPTLADLARDGTIASETARFLGEGIRLHRHQHEALLAARTGQPYVVSTGTGSGKSLTYLLPIVDHIFRAGIGNAAVQAIIVYPMNALINSQLEALDAFRARNGPDCPLDFKRYTGQERNEQREAILASLPHILLTNYVMLEYMLIRPYERSLVEQATRDLRFLVMDELHVYPLSFCRECGQEYYQASRLQIGGRHLDESGEQQLESRMGKCGRSRSTERSRAGSSRGRSPFACAAGRSTTSARRTTSPSSPP